MRWCEDEIDIPENSGRLAILSNDVALVDVHSIVDLLRQDMVVLIRHLTSPDADRIAHDVANEFGLGASLELQAAFAGFHGHRQQVSQYFMSVNQREDYQFIPPHSEGSSSTGLQLASFFCHENTTDGGETILMNVDESSVLWPSLREKIRRGKLTAPLSNKGDILQARTRYKIDVNSNLLRDDDEVLHEQASDIRGLTLVDVLAKPQKIYSKILNRGMHAYWDSIASIDFGSGSEFMRLLEREGRLKKPENGIEMARMDNAYSRRIMSSSISYKSLFKYKITRKLEAGELVIFNNMTWTHAANNWSPNSGVRQVTAAFA